MAELFDKDTDTIRLHVRNIYNEGELPRIGTTEESSVVQNEGGRKVCRQVSYYKLDVIISLGYRIKSKHGAQFRQRATRVARALCARFYSERKTAPLMGTFISDLYLDHGIAVSGAGPPYIHFCGSLTTLHK